MPTLIDMIQDKAWALHPGKLAEINAFLENRLQNPNYSAAEDIKVLMTANDAEEDDSPYRVVNGVAVISAVGTVSKRFNMFMKISGGVSTEMLKRNIAMAVDDRKIRGIVLDVESPGGAVDGTKELSDFIYESRTKKPIVAYANGLMASAGYWFGSAAHAIVTNETAIVGSIGVALTHYDLSARDKAMGVVRTEIYAGRFKRLASSEKPLTDEGREYLQGMVDQIFSIFVEAVSRNRGISQEQALTFCNGKEFIGKEALENGLVDRIGTLQTAIDLVLERSKTRMDITALQKDHPDLYAQVFEMGKAEASKGLSEKIQAAVGEERTRVTEILKAEGNQAETLKAVESGMSVGEAYKGFYMAEKNSRSAGLQGMAAEATKPVKAGEPRSNDGKTYLGEIDRLVASGKTKAQAVSIVAKEQPALYQSYLDSQAAQKN